MTNGLPTLPVFHNMAHSGGTLISRCIGSMSKVRLVSEIHPLGHKNKSFNALCQYQEWHRDLRITDWKQHSFLETIHLLYKDCQRNGEQLVIRDWAHIDYIGPPALRPPGFQLLLDQKLKPYYQLQHCALVRHPLELWSSLRKLKIIIDSEVDFDRFLLGYRKYVESVTLFEIVRYEDFTQQPDRFLQKICTSLGIVFDQRYQNRWQDYHNITGDIYDHSRGSSKQQIIHFPIRPLDEEFSPLIAKHENYRWLIARLGYEY